MLEFISGLFSSLIKLKPSSLILKEKLFSLIWKKVKILLSIPLYILFGDIFQLILTETIFGIYLKIIIIQKNYLIL